MRRTVYVCLIVLAGAFVARAGWAQSTPAAIGADDDPSPHSRATLVSDVASIQPGTPFTVALRMEMEGGWHSYWKNPGDSGQPTSIAWALPTGFSAGAIQWPYPHRIDAGPLTSYGYSDEVLLLTEITPPDDLVPGTTVTLAGAAEWLICADICLPAEEEIALTLPVRDATPSPNDAWHDAVAAAEQAVPKSLSSWSVQASRSEGSYALTLTPPAGRDPALEGAHFFPDEKAVLDHAAPQPVSKDGDRYLMALQQSEYAQAPAERLTGVLVAPEGTTWGGQARAMTVDVPVLSSQEHAAAAAGGDRTSTALWWTLLSAFIGGVLLNLMPCVFPVLSVKMLGFARQGGDDDRTIRRHGLVFGVGVLVSFWVLAGALLGLRAAGSEVGWGFQLQSPLFVALMTMLFFGIGLNLLGVFEVGNQLMSWSGRMERSASEEGFSGSFLSGVLATLVATPCTAPFMGAALGVALTLSTAGSLLVFTALGAGMATPYVALSMMPALLQRLPEPGAWMETLKQVLAFPMFAAAVWLLWVFGRQVGPDGMAFLLLGLLLLALAGWTVGRWSPLQISTRFRVATRSVAMLSLMGAIALGVMGAQHDAPAEDNARPSEGLAWASFSPDTVEQLRADGRPVFIDFTAAWCLTCQVNKRTTLTSDAVEQAFNAKNVALVRADWTNRDPAITRALEAHGRSGVPLYVLYEGDGSDPILLPEILTEDTVLEALDRIPGDTTAAPSVADRRPASSS